MKKNLISRFALLFAAVTSFVITACNSNKEEPIVPDNSLQDIVTLTGATDKGFTVTFRKENDSPLVTLTFAGEGQQIDTTIVKLGQRFLLAYRPQSGLPYVSGPATAYAYRNIPNVKLTFGSRDKNDSWMSEQVQVLEFWRTGSWLNLNAVVPIKNSYKKLTLVVDETTRDNEIPTAYLLYLSDNPTEAAGQQLVATFDISEIWDDAKYKGLTVVVANSNGNHRFSFQKGGAEIIKPNE